MLPAGSLDLVSEQTTTAISEAVEALEQLTADSRALAGAIVSLSKSGDLTQSERKAARKTATALTRDNLLVREIDENGPLAGFLEEQAAYHFAKDRHLQGLRKLERVLALERDTAAEGLAKLCQAGDVGVTLERFSPGTYEQVTADPRARKSSTARTAYKYVVRAALKPSPFAALARVGAVGIPFHDMVARVPVHVLHQLVEAAAKTPSLHSRWSYRRAEASGTLGVILRHWRNTDGFLWPYEEVVPAEALANDWGDLASWSDGTYTELTAATGASPARTLRWLHQGLIQVVMPWEAAIGDPLTRTIEVLNEGSSGARVADPLSEAARVLAGLPDDEAERSADLRVVTSRIQQAFTSLGESYTGAAISEDAGIQDPNSVEQVPADASQLDFLRGYIFTSHMYSVLVDAFVGIYNPGGSTSNAKAFLDYCAGDPEVQRGLASAKLADSSVRSSDVTRSLPPQVRSLVPPTLAVIYQQMGSEAGIVINQVTEGLGGLVSRFAHLDSTYEGKLRSRISQWCKSLVGDAVTVYEFSPASAGNSAQYLSQGVFPSILWDAVQGRATGTDKASFEDLSLQHDVSTNSLRFQLAGNAVAPVYMGLVPSWQVQGAQGLACILMNPWVERTPVSELNHPLFRDEIATQHLRLPRVSQGNVVLRRETWHFAVPDLPVVDAAQGPAMQLLAFATWRKAHDIPVEVFVLPLGNAGGAISKPMWVNFESLLSIEFLLSVVKSHDAIRIQEVLPSREAYVSDRRATELVSFVSWAQ